MARKRAGARRSNPLQIQIVPVSLPEGVTRAGMFKQLKRAVRTKELPEGWEVNLRWRNPATKKGRSKDWQEGDWQDVLENSSTGFSTAVTNATNAAIAGMPSEELSTKKEVKQRKQPKRTAAELHAVRSAASKKGWETRRRNAAQAAKGGRKK